MSAMKGSAFGLPMMLSAGADNIVKVWNMKKFKCVSEIQIGTVTGPLTKAAWVGQSVVTASGGNIRLWDYNKHDCYSEPSEMKSSNTIFESRAVSAKPDSSPFSEWGSKILGSHAQTCTDLISTDQYVASSSKSGQIYRWSKDWTESFRGKWSDEISQEGTKLKNNTNNSTKASSLFIFPPQAIVKSGYVITSLFRFYIYIFRNIWYLTRVRFRENLKLTFYFRFFQFRLDVI